jgi:hypothetical protein
MSSQFENNYVSTNGGCLFSNVKNMVLYNNSYTNNSAASGSVIYFDAVANNSKIDITESQIILSQAQMSASILITSSQQASIAAIISNSSFTQNKGMSGSCVCVIKAGSLDVINSTFMGNNASESGGCIYLQQTLLRARNCTLRNNTARLGGGIFSKDAIIELDNSALSNNNAVKGGAMYVQRSDASGYVAKDWTGLDMSYCSIMNTAIEGNSAQQQGGGIYAFASKLRFQNSSLVQNTAHIGGGLYHITFHQSSLSSVDSIWNANRAVIAGGAIYIYGINTTISLHGTDVSQNEVHGNYSKVTSRFNPVTSMCDICERVVISPFSGGGLFVSGSNITLDLDASNFQFNTADANGGGVHIEAPNCNLTMASCTILNHGGISGGGLSTQPTNSSSKNVTSSVYMKNSYFANNYAEGNGGGMSLSLNDTSESLRLSVETSVFDSNAAFCQGGGISLFTNNVAWLNVSSTSFTNNTAAYGGAVFVQGNYSKRSLPGHKKAGKRDAVYYAHTAMSTFIS